MSKRDLPLLGLGLLFGAAVGALIIWGPVDKWLGFNAGQADADFNAFEGLETAPRVGAPAPDFALSSLTGETVRLSEFQGSPVMINFWATWCGPCLIEMPTIQEQYDRHKPELVVLAVNFDEPAVEVQTYADELGLTFPVLLDSGGEVNERLYQVRGYPSSFFVDEEGIIQVVHIGMLTDGQLEGYLQEVGLRP